MGAVDVREDGRQRFYRLNGRALKPIHDWVKEYESTWSERFEKLDAVLEVTLAEIDLPVGGRWRYVMVADRGFQVAFHGACRWGWTSSRKWRSRFAATQGPRLNGANQSA